MVCLQVRIWDTFMRYIEPYASAAPYMIGVGNHEYDYRTGGEKHPKRHHPDASGSEEPYDPDWGNYGARGLLLLSQAIPRDGPAMSLQIGCIAVPHLQASLLDALSAF